MTAQALLAVASVLGAVATFAGLFLARRSAREANETTEVASTAAAKLSDVQVMQAVVETLNTETERLRSQLRDANDLVGRVNAELRVAQRNVKRLREACEANGVPVPHLEVMHDVP